MRHHLTKALKATLRFRTEVVLLAVVGALLLWWGTRSHHGNPEPKQLPSVPAGGNAAPD